MGTIRAFFMRVFPHRESYEPPPPMEGEEEAQRLRHAQMARLREAMDSRKRLDETVDSISEQLEHLGEMP